jgi:hypothetical protein
MEAERLDVGYMEHWSITGDVVILLKTVVVVLRAVGSYWIPTEFADFLRWVALTAAAASVLSVTVVVPVPLVLTLTLRQHLGWSAWSIQHMNWRSWPE